MNINILLDLEGRMDQAVKPVRYVVLTNDKDLSFSECLGQRACKDRRRKAKLQADHL